MKRASLLLSSVLALGLIGVARGTPGDLDPSFGTGGIANLATGPNSDVTQVIAEPDGGVVTVGQVQNPFTSSYDIAVARFAPSGSPVDTFGGGGLLRVDFGGREFGAGIVRQPDGRLVVVGSGVPNPPDTTPRSIVLARLNDDGSFDPTFGTGGKVTTRFSTFADDPHGIALQPDGKIVVAGDTVVPGQGFKGLVVRYEADGTLDTGFGAGGKTVIDLPSNVFNSVLVQPDGRIVAGGVSNGPVTLARLEADGTLDATFGVGGIVTFPIGNFPLIKRIQRQPDGKIVAGGGAEFPQFIDSVLARFDGDGSADAAFGTGGVVSADLAPDNNDYLVDVALQGDGKIVAAGTASADQFIVIRYLDTGAFDSGFGSGGVVRTPFSGIASSRAITLIPDGRIVVAGTSGASGSPAADQIIIARYLVSTCGNGLIEAGEQCEDGNTVGGDCCSAICRWEVTGAPCADDGRACTADVCDGGGTCTHPADVRASCELVTKPGAAKLDMRDSARASGDTLTWIWRKGQLTTLDDLGNPLLNTGYSFCLFDEGSSTPSVLLEMTFPPAGTCGGVPCWSVAGALKLRYKNREGTPDGAAGLVLKSGASGRAAVTVMGKGESLALPGIPLALPVRAQLHATNGTCWDATFAAGSARRNDLGRFSASGGP